MMKRRHHTFFQAALLMLVGGIAPAIWLPISAYAQEENKEIIKISIFYVSENVACKPNGYPDQGTGALSQCEAYNSSRIDEFEKENNEARIYYKSLPPETIKLDGADIRKIHTYSNLVKRARERLGSDRRRAILFIFEREGGFTGRLRLSRFGQENDSPKYIENYVKTVDVDGERRFVHHERADAILPRFSFKWQFGWRKSPNDVESLWVIETE